LWFWFANQDTDDSFSGLAIPELRDLGLLRFATSEFFKSQENSFRACPDQPVGSFLILQKTGEFWKCFSEES